MRTLRVLAEFHAAPSHQNATAIQNKVFDRIL